VEDIKSIIKESSFTAEEGRFVYAKVFSVPDLNGHFMVSRDGDEITVVTKEENLSGLDLIERNPDYYRLIALNVSKPFYSVGFLATVSQALASQGMNILIVSTYSKDYVLVKEDRLEEAKLTLLKLGLKLIK